MVPLDFQAPAVERGDGALEVRRTEADSLFNSIPCVAACPASTDVPLYVSLIAEGRFADALTVNREANMFPALLCYVCPHPCETTCRRGLIDAPVAIRNLKRAAVEFGQGTYTAVRLPDVMTGKRVAVVGSGPAGMAAALLLREWGHDVAIYEGGELGGMLASAIPPFRLPRDSISDQVRALADAGVELHAPVRVGDDVPLESLVDAHDAVLLAMGCQESVVPRIPGFDLAGVHGALGVMHAMTRGEKPSLGEDVIVVGAGLVGIDCARSAIRQGARSVRVFDIAREDQLTYDPSELRLARHEGIEFFFETAVTRANGRDKVEAVETVPYAGNSAADGQNPREWPADSIIVAVGQARSSLQLGTDTLSIPRASDDYAHVEGWPRSLFAAGDYLKGPSSVPEAVLSGRQAALGIHSYLMGAPPEETMEAIDQDRTRRTIDHRLHEHDEYDRIGRQPTARRPASTSGRFVLEEFGYTEAVARTEAQRCLQCQMNLVLDPEECLLCGRCAAICPYACISLVPRESVATVNGDPDAPELAEAWRWADGAAVILDETRCIRCGLCVDRCPSGCLTFEESQRPANSGLPVRTFVNLAAELSSAGRK